MSGLFEQKYKNNTRIISGLNNVVYQDDVVLQCDTTLNPVSLNLLSIPVQKWSTLYKLYVVDSGNNAAINNITINAPLGFLINGAASAVILDNGGSYLIRVSSDTSYNGQYSNGSGVASNGHIIQDEGIDLPQRLRLNFIGGGVYAFDDLLNNRTNVHVIGGILNILNADLIALCNNGSVIKGQFYKVTDCPLAQLGVIVHGISTSQVSLQGSGNFYNADYQGVGNYSGVIAFSANIGIWSITARPVVIGDVVLFNNRHFVNLLGNWGTDPSTDAINWLLLDYNILNGYIIETDEVKYDLRNNYLTYRADKRGNIVERSEKFPNNSLAIFQWGKDDTSNNKVLSRSMMDCVNSNNSFNGNTLISGAEMRCTATKGLSTGGVNFNTIIDSSLVFDENFGDIRENVIESKSRIIIETSIDINSYIRYNSIRELSSLNIKILIGGEFAYNQIFGNSVVNVENIFNSFLYSEFKNKSTFTANQLLLANSVAKILVDRAYISIDNIPTWQYNSVTPFYSDFEAVLDLNDATIYNALSKTLTIPVEFRSYVGIYKFQNSTGKDIEICTNLPVLFPVKFMPDGTALPNNLQIVFTPIGVVVLGNFVADNMVSTVGTTLLTAYSNASDFVVIQRNSIYNLVSKKIIQV